MSRKKSSVKKLDQISRLDDPMAALLAKSSRFTSLKAGSKVEGQVVEIGNKVLILDIGAKAEGVVAEREFETASSYIQTLEIGDKVTAEVVIPETSSGQTMMSLSEAAQESGWGLLEKALSEGLQIEALVVDANRGGLIVEALGVPGFIPTSGLSTALAKNTQNIIGKSVSVRVIEFDRSNHKLVLSEKAISESHLIEAQRQAFAKIKKGEKFKGRVVGIVAFGAFVQITVGESALDGLVHLSEISYERVSDASQVLTVGQEVEVMVIGQEKNRLALSIKQAQADPWEKNLEGLKEDQKVKGKVIRLGDFGAVFEVVPGVEGRIALNKIPDGVSLREGDLVDVFIEEIDPKKHQITLGLVLTAKPVGYK